MSEQTDYLESYVPRDWTVYEIPLAEADAVKLTPDSSLLVCNADSPMAKDLKESEGRFYADYELMVADRNPSAGTQLGRLTDEWRGHTAGTLAMLSFEKIHEGQMVVLVENAS